MKIKKLKWILFSGIFAIVAAVSALTVGKIFGNAEPSWSENTLEAEYVYGQELEIPKRTLTDGDNEYEATVVVEKPDQTATRLTKVTLDQFGTYVVRYTANGQTVEESFLVRNLAYAFSGGNSSAQYGYDSRATEADSGLMVRLAAGETMNVNTVVSVEEMTKDNSLVEVYINPDTTSVIDFTELYLTISDAIDPSISFDIKAKYSKNTAVSYHTYVHAGVGGKYAYYNANGVIQKNKENDFPFGYPFGGISFNACSPGYNWVNGTYDGSTGPEVVGGKNSFRFAFDNNTKELYANEIVVCDLDDIAFFDIPFEGFPSGYATLSISAGGIVGSSANFVLQKWGSADLTDEILVDNVAPEIVLDTEYAEAPNGLVGQYYPIPTASATDIYSGKCKVSTNVYYNYGTEKPVMAEIKNGAFLAEKEGLYIIEYTAIDASQNQAVYAYPVYVEKSLDEIVVSIATPETTASVLGAWVNIPTASAVGGSGNKTISVVVKAPDGTETVIQNGFRPEQVGEYTVTYTATDYIGQKESDSYKVVVERGDKPVFVSEPVFPDYYISGKTYTLPEVEVRDYTSGKMTLVTATADVEGAYEELWDRELKQTIYSPLDTFSVTMGETFTPIVKENYEKVRITYKAGTVAYGTVEIPVVRTMVEEECDDGKGGTFVESVLDQTRYFVTNGVALEKMQDNITVTATEENGSWKFINPVYANDFALNLVADATASEYDGWRITLTDSKDKSVSLTFDVLKDGARSILSYNGKTYAMLVGFDSTSTSNLFKMGHKDGKLFIGSFTLQTTDFERFTSKCVYVEVSFINAKTFAAYKLQQLNGQTFNELQLDAILPKIYVNGDYGGNYTIGTTVSLPTAEAYDVLDPNLSFSLTVNAPDGTVVSDVNGVSLRDVDPAMVYTFTFKQYGQYSVTYTAQDSTYNTATFSYAFNIVEDIAPEIVLTSSYVTTAKVGDTVVMPSFEVSDNFSEAVLKYPDGDPVVSGTYKPSEAELFVVRSVSAPNGRVYYFWGKSNSIKVESAGTYTFRIQACDKAGNVATFVYTVEVKP